MKVAIVIGGNHHNTLGVIRSLGEKNIYSEVILIGDDDDPYISHSRYIADYCQLHNICDLCRELENRKNRYVEKPIIFSCADFVTSHLDLHQDVLEPYYILPIGPNKGSITYYMDKERMVEIAEKCNLRIPHIYDSHSILDNTSFPIIAKPLSSIEGSKGDISVINDKSQLLEYIESSNCPRILFQDFVEKETEFQLIGCSLNGGESVIIPGISIIIRQPRTTNTGFLKYVPISDFPENGLVEKCMAFVKAIGYSGLFSIEFLRDKSGVDYFMEINMRNDGNAICVTAAGVNLSYIWYAANAGYNYEDEINRKVRSVYVMPEFSDFSVAMRIYKIGILNWLRDVRRTNRFMEFDSKDPKPFWILLYQTIKRRLA